LLKDLGHFELPADVDEIPEDVPAISKLGDVWLCGEHRVMCGDSTDAKNVAKLMNGKTAQLLHADPPYGMGKEKEGVLNDNLYASKLDKFQMFWWNTCRKFLDDNASAYIWGNPEDLWRLWYVGGLKDSEKLTMQNELVWTKPSGFGQSSDLMISFPINTERCLFFQFGHQFVGNINAEDFPEEWESLRSYLANEADKAGITPADIKKLCGVQMYSHWFSKSQFHLIGEKHYQRLADHYQGCFIRSWSELKTEWDATLAIMLERKHHKLSSFRSFFNNSHDNMNEVWQFGRVTGQERHGHATPKPVEMICRVFKSSAPVGSITLEPFGGSGSTLIAAQQTNRTCYTMELDPHYVDVICARYQKHTGNQPILEATGEPHNFL
jgi:DNA modification methylase